MKTTANFMGTTMKKLGVALAVVALTWSASAQSSQGQASTREVVGTADFTEGSSGVWVPLRVGKKMTTGGTIRTAAGSSATFNLEQAGPWVRSYELTTLSFDRIMFDKVGSEYVVDTRLDLQAGRISGTVDRTSSASRFEVKTPQTVVGLRGGSSFDIYASGLINVVGGQAVVVHTDSEGAVTQHLVNAGQTFDPVTVSVVATPVAPIIPDYPSDNVTPTAVTFVEEQFISAFPYEFTPDGSED